jgi:hypothetical protein
LVSNENLACVNRCHSNNRGNEIKTALASEVSSTRFVRDDTIYFGLAVITGSFYIDYRLAAMFIGWHNIFKWLL